MAKTKKSEKVPKGMQDKYNEIIRITDDFSKKHLNEEYAELIRAATAALCRKRPSPLVSGRSKTWACGITHAIGMVNFLFDSSQTPHMSAKDLYKAFGVGQSSGQGKSKQVRDLLDMMQLDPNWSLPSQIGSNPLAWMILVDGFMMDARRAPREVQIQAYEKGLIPYLPEASDKLPSLGKASKKKASTSSSNALYTFDVFLVGGPVTDEFVEKNPSVSRTIEIRGDQTLEDLHDAIFEAFDREEPHMYEFQIGGRGPNDPDADRYVLPSEFDDPDEKAAGEVSSSEIGGLGLSSGDVFGYWFDFGDDWWHQVNVESIQEAPKKGRYPKITNRVGDSPPQYPDFEDE